MHQSQQIITKVTLLTCNPTRGFPLPLLSVFFCFFSLLFSLFFDAPFLCFLPVVRPFCFFPCLSCTFFLPFYFLSSSVLFRSLLFFLLGPTWLRLNCFLIFLPSKTFPLFNVSSLCQISWFSCTQCAS